jgi:hypothetical protein
LPATHEAPAAQVAQATPPVPHAALLAPVWHLLYASQQPEQLLAPQIGVISDPQPADKATAAASTIIFRCIGERVAPSG